MPLILVVPSLTFEIWEIIFSWPFLTPSWQIGVRYITIAIDYVSKWEKVEPIKVCISEVEIKLNYKNIFTIFGFPLTLINYIGTHFINKTIEFLLKYFPIDHHMRSSCHPQSNDAIKYFKKKITKGLTKICNLDKDDWDDEIIAILWGL